MDETVVVAIVGVGGTVIGASIAPVTSLIRDVATDRRDRRALRLQTCAELSRALVALAKAFGSSIQWSSALEAASEARFNLARYLPRRSGSVDRFVQCALDQMVEAGNKTAVQEIAKFASSWLMEWARGDRSSKTLTPFEAVPVAGGGWEMV